MTIRRPTIRPLLVALGLTCAFPAFAQYQAPAQAGGANARPWTAAPRVGSSLSVTDNVDLASSGERSETVVELTPGLRLQAATRTLTGQLDYQRREFHYLRDSSPRRGQNQLSASGSLEAIDDTLTIDAAGSITEQTVSAFGAQGSGGATLNPNKAENRVFSLSPALRGQVGGYFDYMARYTATAARSDSTTTLGDSDSQQATARFGGGTPLVPLSWSVSGTSQRVEFANGRESESDSADGRLTWLASSQLRLWASGGRESNNYLSVDRESHTTHGAGFEWSPSQRTQLMAGRERRFFGDADTVAFSHRSGWTTLRFDHSRSVSSPADNLTDSGGAGTLYDLVDAQLAASIPDPAERAAAVDEFLTSRGLAPDTQATSGFLSARVYVQRASTLSLLLAGRRNSVVIAGSRSEREALGAALLGDDFDASQRILQSGVSANWNITVSPRTALSLGGSRQRTTGEGSTVQQTTLTSIQAGLTMRPGPRTTMALRLRQTEAADTAQPYTENSVTISLNYTL